ncbi:hypothetical protein BDQ17DRAFT_1378123 [Cyathus striatus]|nr:hypothetical protein BDQ17DRAFT_1378123 [Cyathus striatus]
MFRDEFDIPQSFIGCSNWARSHRQDHINHYSRSIPQANGVSLDILRRLFFGLDIYDPGRPGSISNDVHGLLNGCTNIVHPASVPTFNKCSYVHLAVGQHETGNLYQIGCSAKLTVFTPVDRSDYRAIIIPEIGKPHSHPTFRPRKIPFSVKEEYQKCIKAVGSLSATTSKVDSAVSTREILSGHLPQELHGSLINNRKRRKLVQEERNKEFPQGVDIYGVMHERGKEKVLPPAECYIRSVHEFSDQAHVVVTLNTYLASFMLDAVWIMVDTTFKVVHGDTNEFKVVIWVGALNRSLVVGRVWSNSATREAFFNIWNGLFSSVKVVTGKELNFHIFSPSSPLLGVIGDAEGAQAQGFGDMVLARSLNKSNQTGIILSDSDSVLLHLWKTCLVHFNRGVLNLRSHISEQDEYYLKSFPSLDSDLSIQRYKNFCLQLGQRNKKVKDWWAHKLSYPWLLPSLNRHLSLMHPDHWDLLPSNTNIVESSHANDNHVTSTNHSLLQAILFAKALDNNTARVLKASVGSGVLTNSFNSDQQRFAAQGRRNAHAHHKRSMIAVEKQEQADIKVKTKRPKVQLKKGKRSMTSATSNTRSTTLKPVAMSSQESCLSAEVPGSFTPATFPFAIDQKPSF